MKGNPVNYRFRPRRVLVSVVALLSLLIAAHFAGMRLAAQSPLPPSAEKDTQAGSSAAAQRSIGSPTKQAPQHIPGGFDLPNGWRITPAGKAIATIEDLVLNLVPSPDGRIVIASHSGYLPHGIDVFDTKTQKVTQHIELKSTWLG